jgi:hypothetical protein
LGSVNGEEFLEKLNDGHFIRNDSTITTDILNQQMSLLGGKRDDYDHLSLIEEI